MSKVAKKAKAAAADKQASAERAASQVVKKTKKRAAKSESAVRTAVVQVMDSVITAVRDVREKVGHAILGDQAKPKNKKR